MLAVETHMGIGNVFNNGPLQFQRVEPGFRVMLLASKGDFDGAACIVALLEPKEPFSAQRLG